jgi:hypothetical protein
MRSDYWRNTTAEALMLGRMAYGYVVWQGIDQPREEAESFPPQLEPVLTRGEDPALTTDKSASVLALLHSSTQRQAVPFVVSRDKLNDRLVDDDLGENDLPTPSRPIIRPFDLNPERLAPMDNVISKVDVFVGLHGGFPALSRHPLIAVLKAARKKLIVLEAQLPFPPPLVEYHDKQWGRVRVALRDTGDIRRLTKFLDEVYEAFAEPEYSAHVLAIQTVPTGPPTVIFKGRTSPAANGGGISAVGSGDLYVPAMNEPSNVPTWRMVTRCAEARSNIESDIIAQLTSSGMSNFQLMHLNFAVVHGIAVIIALLHKSGAPNASSGSAYYVSVGERHVETLETAPSSRTSSDQTGTVIDGKVTWDQLGPTVPCPLVRIRFS